MTVDELGQHRKSRRGGLRQTDLLRALDAHLTDAHSGGVIGIEELGRKIADVEQRAARGEL